MVKGEGILVPGNAQFLTLQMEANSSITIIAVYAPGSSNERAALW